VREYKPLCSNNLSSTLSTLSSKKREERRERQREMGRGLVGIYEGGNVKGCLRRKGGMETNTLPPTFFSNSSNRERVERVEVKLLTQLELYSLNNSLIAIGSLKTGNR
jgi:hypothetical protein